jgi:hypothetical protein
MKIRAMSYRPSIANVSRNNLPPQPYGIVNGLCTVFNSPCSHTKARPAGDPCKGEQHLLGYLFARVLVNKKIEGPILHQLRAVNKSINEARSLAPLGRANVTIDIQKDNTLPFRIFFGRRFILDQYPVNNYCAMFARGTYMGTMMCDEGVAMSTYAHLKSNRLEADSELIGCNSGDHHWMEIKTPYSTNIVMDPWANGPAILSEDRAFNAIDTPTSDLTFRSGEGEIYVKGANHMRALTKYDKVRIDNLFDELAILNPPERFNIAAHWNEMPVISSSLKAEIKRSGNEDAKCRMTLNDEIRAIGVWRDLNSNIKQALQRKNEVFQSYKTGFQQGYLGQWTSK